MTSTALARPAAASDGVALAESLFQRARELMESGHVEQACEKFAESQRLDPGLGTLLNLASCNEKLGKLATAWGQFQQALAEASQNNATARVQFAREQLEALEPRLPKLVIEVPVTSRVEGMKIDVDGVDHGEAAWGLPTPVDPGSRVVRVVAPGHRTWTRRLNLAEGKPARIVVPRLDTVLSRDESATASDPAPNSSGGTTRMIAWTALGLGTVSLGLGGFFGIRALQRNADSESFCPTATTCTPRGAELSRQATDDSKIANWTFASGLILATTGTILLLTGGDDTPNKAPRTGWLLAPGTKGAALSYRGAW